jgi:3-isopropylmalate/(R)-2-methylmalate dehydratase large subunit
LKNKTIIEKIFEKHSPDKIEVGNIIWLDIDYRAARDFGGPNVVKHLQEQYGENMIDDRDKTFFTFDTSAPAKTISYAESQQQCRQFAHKNNIHIYDVDMGIGSHVAIEEGIIYPGSTGVSTDSHMNIVGGIGAFGQGMGDVDIAFIFKTGKTWFEVPPSMRVNLKGDFSFPTTAKDIILKIVGTLGSKGALGKAIDYYGDIFDKLKLNERITIASMATEMGAIISFIPPSEEIIETIKKKVEFSPQYSFPDTAAPYSEEVTIDIDNLEPQIALPPSPDNVKNVSEVTSKRIDSVFVGSCTNGRYEDIKQVTDYLEGKTVHPDVMLKIVPATKRVYEKLLKNGDMEKLVTAGAIVSNPGCGGCAQGQIGMTGKGEVQVSTANRNYPGKQGAGDTYLVSPVVAAASAVKGEISLP